MYCSKCGKQVKEDDNFCKYCGADLREKGVSQKDEPAVFIEAAVKQPVDTEVDEEFVLYDVKKHFMSLFWAVFWTPIFFMYFWNVFLNTHSFFSWIVVFAMLIFISYPILRYNSDKIVITNKFAHIKLGILNILEEDIPIEELEVLQVSQTTLGRFFGYGLALLCLNGERFDYGYIQKPEDLEYIIENPQEFIKESLEN